MGAVLAVAMAQAAATEAAATDQAVATEAAATDQAAASVAETAVVVQEAAPQVEAATASQPESSSGCHCIPAYRSRMLPQ